MTKKLRYTVPTHPLEKPISTVVLLLAFTAALSLNAVVSEVPSPPEAAESWFEAMHHSKHPEKMTKVHFFFHDHQKGEKVTSAVVARSNAMSRIPFGTLAVGDDPMTVGPQFTSKRVGFFRGLYGTSSFEGLALFTAMSFVFTDEVYNGSMLSVLGNNPSGEPYREVPIVGGSGRFRLARGVATFDSIYSNLTTGNYTVEV